jgi:MraZ protein
MREKIILSRGPDKCITVYPISELNKLSETLASRAIGKTASRTLNRAIFGSAFDASFDKQGRVVLPTVLREFADIKDEITIVGVNNTVEMWNTALWKEEQQKANEQYSQIIESLEV